MSDITRILDRGYTMIWREGRLVEALRGLEEDFEWVVPDRGRGRESGVPAEMRFFQLWTFRDGRPVRMETFSDPDQARPAAGLA